ncbi:hypothetical protein [Nocardia spumae]|uniref:hypothetical protein n=1 Tax=Nocardia spumae TaxID=2887190 RepID=UPI001D139F02|nr:hypothetical protein [Nocardia spumae]
MHRERPAHPLRWIALCLFVFGSLLDLLAGQSRRESTRARPGASGYPPVDSGSDD